MQRTRCVICDNALSHLYTINSLPISLSSTIEDIHKDMFQDQVVTSCSQCGCVQLENLIDPQLLYQSSHNITFHLPTWKEHHMQFSEFIQKNSTTLSIMEIGGSSGALYQHLKHNNMLNYSCMDICDANFDTSNITYIKGNCEDYLFDNVNTVALSHVFEHLYKPKQFIENLAKHHVQNVFISIPNLSYLLSSKSSSVIHYEHTYYVDYQFINYLFSIYGYSLHAYKEFKNHSLFFMFTYTNCNALNISYRDNIALEMRTIYNNMYDRLTRYTMDENSFIVPGGHMGQLIYTINKPEKIIGFLDNDTSKHNKRVYGTPYFVYPFSKLKEYNQPINVFVYAGPYVNEIVEQLSEYKHCKIITY